MKLLLTILFLCAAAVDAQWWSSWFSTHDADDSTPHATWNGLKVTFGVNPFFGNNFDSMPRTTEMADEKGWTQFGPKSCSAGTWQGFRYVKNSDPAVILLFDKNGYIAGMQMGVYKSELPSDGSVPPARITPPWIKDESKDMLLLTVYFVQPSEKHENSRSRIIDIITRLYVTTTGNICGEGRTDDEYQEAGTGTGLYIQTGPNPTSDVMSAPLQQADVEGTDWTRGECFWAMGQHYWYKFRPDMNCDDFYPVFLLYNDGKLNGFGWNINTPLDSPRYESPPTGAVSLFFAQKPPCFDEHVHRGISTLHIYLDDSPSSNFC
ncbi:uncharacterized protein LOC118430084 [Branchiostoma floridae]|uniref:Uncharacterized protein LOC118430084 n=1 Tax=Branchiostoma floridae TaxID=7739 RepID=A0A9J7M8E8_BRAFL|nr:uncharacterized protein LOC118430084 [Branchiostoma floridae]